MIELRWVCKDSLSSPFLQYRTRGFQVDAAGALCGVTDWSDWERVPVVVDKEEWQKERNKDFYFSPDGTLLLKYRS